ncbi:MAG: sulfatase, partial [Gemmataceae bacterium]
MNLPRFMHFETDRITIRQCLAITLVFCAMGSECWASERPNIVLIISDDQSWDTFSFLGGKVHTPRLDQMAKDGMYFSNFHVTTTVCSPSRYSFLTGRYAGRCKSQHFLKLHPPGTQTQVENNVELEPHLWNLAKILQRAGYRTGFVGKSHIIRHDWLRAKKGWPQNANPRNPKIMAMMREHHQKWCKEMKKYGFDYVDGIYPANLKELGCDALNVHNLDWTVDKAIRFLESSKDRPFFLCVCTTLHHGPAPWVNRYSLDADPRMTSAGFVPRGFNVLPSRKDVLKRNRKAGFKDRKA